jgi:hypothetical protein
MLNLACVNELIRPSIPVKGVVELDTGILEGPTSRLSILRPQSMSRHFIPRDSLDAVASELRSVEIIPFLLQDRSLRAHHGKSTSD